MQESSRSEDSRGKMALSVKLIARQGQSMALTPQLLQAIKLLEMPAAELSAFVENELTSNPLLERAEGRESEEFSAEGFATEPEAPVAPGDWAADELETDRAALESRLGTELENAFESDPASGAALSKPGDGLSLGFWRGARTGAGDGEPPNLDVYVAESPTLRCHLERQAAILLVDHDRSPRPQRSDPVGRESPTRAGRLR